MFNKWRDRDVRKLRKLEKYFEKLNSKFETLLLDYDLLRSSHRHLKHIIKEKEVTHVQRVQVELTKPFDYDGWYP